MAGLVPDLLGTGAEIVVRVRAIGKSGLAPPLSVIVARVRRIRVRKREILLGLGVERGLVRQIDLLSVLLLHLLVHMAHVDDLAFIGRRRERNINRSWPFLAATSAFPLVGRSTRLMLSTVTSVLFFCPHSTVYFLLNHSSQAGTKWLHCRIFSVFCCAAARSGNRNAGPSAPAAIVPAAPILKKSLRDTPLPFFSSFIAPLLRVP